jgi:prenyltransferase beta subunit
MRKHEVNYHEKINIIEIFSKFCIYSRKLKTRTTNKEKNISFEKKFFLNQSNHSKFDVSIKNSRKQVKIVIKVLFRKEIRFDQLIDQSTYSLSRKDQKSTKSINKMQILNAVKDFRLNLNELEIFNLKDKKLSEINVAIIKTSTFNMINKRKNVNLFSIILKNVEKHFKKHNKSNIVI